MIFPWHLGRNIRILALDVDGVLTDGVIHLDADGHEHKRFHVTDGLGIRLLLEAGIKVGLITARNSRAVARRAEELSLSFVHQGIRSDKWTCLKEELSRSGFEPAQCACMGDDLIDLPILCRVGLATAPFDARPEVRQRVHWVANAPGGRGAVRELAEGLLMAQGRWENLVAGYVPKE
ncbi:MAG: phenylphosphate carboxylase subunit delta [Magnetococcales bacterium]|nr:phenylphosphate carboxylase subunit delta [Magnetococcales bacterium]MBF0151276.1 phenylphosphate carboxylase subunit delta [Magnetococcales bacterium]MBF0174159.1 phenylphosphate carboxylase subunit delta [Magnetococcales bacterium]MBF0347369.1 phenylphosphate carboxylase subunit delta [Magnetococcales bacterium]MBF0632742.1 phenylphosphate carboxylase subunit delta [Magnetococcales bacterium]